MKKLLSFTENEEERLALIEDDRLVRYETRPRVNKGHASLGSIVLGRIEQMVIPLHAAYVDIAEEENVFLPLDGRELSRFAPGMELAVQIHKERDSYKKTNVTDNLTLQGQFVVLTSAGHRIGISKKITSQETRDRLTSLAKEFPLYGQAGYILRTEAQDADPELILREAGSLSEKYRKILEKIPFAGVGDVLYRRDSFIVDFLLEEGISSFDEVLFDNRQRMKNTLEELDLRQLSFDPGKLRYYEDPRWTLQDIYHIQHQLAEASVSQVFLSDNGYLFIEKTQALVSIDVNSGNLSGQKNKERAVTDANLRAIPEIVRQIRLRNLSGIILIDFINMDMEENRDAVILALRKEFLKDKRKVSVYGFTHLQLCEISREKMGHPLEV